MPNELRLSIRRKDGVRELDQHILAACQGRATLVIPSSIKYGGALGHSVAYAQFVATWAAAHSTPKVETKLLNSSPDDCQRFVSRLHGLAIAYYADQVTTVDGETNLRSELLKAARPRVSAMSERRYAEAARGQMTEFVFVNRARNQFHSAAYRYTPTRAELMDPERHGELIVSPREMNALAGNVIRAQNLTSSDFKRIEPLLNDQERPLGHLLQETFRNTAEHAYLVDGRIPQKGLRCIVVSAPGLPPDAFQPESLLSADHPHADDYFREMRAPSKRKRRDLVHTLEISIFDTGPGFAKTIGATINGTATDAERVEKCFVNHVSSKPGDNSGLGLGRVLSHVNLLGGYLRIRTSTTEAFFSSRFPLESPLVPHVVGSLPNITGTALTIVIPLTS